MLKDFNSSAIVAVRDIARARDFYNGVLGLTIEDDSMGDVLTFHTGATRLIIYRSDEAGTNRANAVVWDVGDRIEAIVDALREKGVTFEHYEDMGMRIEGDIHVADGLKLVWLKDPDGNVLHFNSM